VEEALGSPASNWRALQGHVLEFIKRMKLKQVEMIGRAASDLAVMSKICQGDVVTCPDHVDLRQTAKT
jgi:hypothetical protein